MPRNVLVTGPPRSGKTTVIQRVRERLDAMGYRAGGIYCPEVRRAGERVGFEIVDVMTDDSRILAHVDQDDGPTVGKYRVNVANVDAVCSEAFSRAFEAADFLIVDEIAPMELYSDVFVTQVRRALDADRPLLAAIHHRSKQGFIGEVKQRGDTDRVTVTEETRDRLPADLTARIRAWLPQLDESED